MLAKEDNLQRAVRLHREGRIAEAEAIYRRVLAQHPDHPDALHLLGALAVQAGRSDEAIALVLRAIARDGEVGAYHNTLGLARRAQGDLAGAAAAFARTLALQPRNSEAHLNLGNLAQDRGDLAGAAEHYRRAIALAPDSAAANSNLGNLLRRQGEADEALRLLERAHQLAPRDPDIANGLALALQAAGRAEAAIERYRAALALAPDHAGALANLGSLLAERDEPEEAVRRLERALALDPSMAEMRVNLANALDALGRHEAALAEWRRLVAERPDTVCFRLRLAGTLRALGRFDEARAQDLESARGDADCAAALAEIAIADKERLAPRWRERIAALLARRELPADDRAVLHFALAKVHDAEGEFDLAFDHLRRANDLRLGERKAKDRGFDLAALAAQFDRLIAAFDRPLFTGASGLGDPSERPVFIVGMPRSGTSLVEQILASHSKVYGAGELAHMERITRTMPARIAGAGPYPECVAALTPATARQAARDYLDRILTLAPGVTRVTDKAPFNFLYLGLAAVLFPRARVIHCRRQPVDTCLSCYEQDFKGPMPWSWDLTTLGQFYRQHDRLMRHWQAVLPLPMLEVSYERLVAEFDATVRRIVAFCGLDWEAACLAFHDNPRPVQTFSQTQVRQPIYASSVDRWRRYERHLGPLIEALGDLAPGARP